MGAKKNLKNCQNIMELLRQKGFDFQVPKKDVVFAIKMTTGHSITTINTYLDTLQMFGFLTPTSDMVFAMNFVPTIPEIV